VKNLKATLNTPKLRQTEK